MIYLSMIFSMFFQAWATGYCVCVYILNGQHAISFLGFGDGPVQSYETAQRSYINGVVIV